ncbi:DNA-directed RNA polymerase subunit beta' [Erysipelothrix urinaevulpis]|uniref:DNA-directed RNA polymerase subunit beta' n=1 Tax=Erysipelothrix urinaevulpis TaxID=2683717 RepID=UPI001359C3CC|nr:DNA-directed RNA polymerase subunit beta' [Erysipelothrix urinaevulpis]
MGINKFASIQLALASPETILEWSHGEVKKPETINYRSQKPERDGLFCEKIFGPSKDWECYCGKYKKVRYRGVICDRCGVEVTKSSVRRERMGHIELAAPVTHIWYLRGIPSRMSLLLDITPKILEEVVYFVKWVVTDPKETDLQYKQIIDDREYREYFEKYGYNSFKAEAGGAAIKTLLEEVDLEGEQTSILSQLEDAKGDKRRKLIRRLETVEAFIESDNKPEWMVLTQLPVIPPELRPMLQLDGGRFAASDANDLYRRVITRNNRLKRLLDMGTPQVIVQNEMRMLQESVDALIDNGRRNKPVTGAGGRPLKSLSHSLKGKQGRFRANLLGKRVDFSGRSVIAVGPDLKMYECGIPKEMAVQLFKPFVVNEMKVRGISNNAKAAEKLIDRQDPRVWDIVEEVIQNHPVLLNRAPTLHRLGIQAFMPKMIEGRAIRLHPLATPAFNADFDGDQMAVHVPLSEMAQAEAELLMLGSRNILGPKDGKPIVTPSQDMVLGNYYLNMEETAEEFIEKAEYFEGLGDQLEADKWRRFASNEGKAFRNLAEARLAYENHMIHLHTRVCVRTSSLGKSNFNTKQNNMYLVTTLGKMIFNDMLPADFPYLNEVSADNFKSTPDKFFLPMGTDVKEIIKGMPLNQDFKKKDLEYVIKEIFDRYSLDKTSEILDSIKDLGFEYSTIAGMTVAISDINVAPNKERYVEEGKAEAAKLMTLYKRGRLTAQEWEGKLMQLWEGVKNVVGGELMETLPRKNPINMMATSGARGNVSNFTQLAGIRGLMGKPTQSKSKKGYQSTIIEVPIYSSFREGLNVSEFFISTHGVRKGLTDTALKTAESGYLTRRLVDVAQDVTIVEEDCFCGEGYLVEEIIDRKSNSVVESLYDRLVGRYIKETVVDPNTKEVIIEEDEYISEGLAKRIVNAGVKQVLIRSVFTCESSHGICQKCYGRNMATGELVEAGEAVGIVAAQSIGEPGTQLTMRTFHTGGVAVAGGEDITQGLPRVEELFEARTPKLAAVISQINGRITEIEPAEDGLGWVITVANDKQTVSLKTLPNQPVRPWFEVGSEVVAGDKLTEGSVDPSELLEYAGRLEVQRYILKEVKKVYQSGGIEISDKHVEVMINQMMRKVRVIKGEDTGLSPGAQIHIDTITEMNQEALMNGKNPAVFKAQLQGITKASVETDSFLSAASFQETTKVLTDAAIKSKIDPLSGLKENVIVGKKIPAGTGSSLYRESTERVKEYAEELKREREERNAEKEEESFINELLNN